MAQQAAPFTLRLTEIEIEGFKSFRDKAVIGPLGDFTCIVGPNGCGKSVVGEAIAFALGGNRKMLRAGKLAGLLNQELSQQAVDGATARTAQVTLVMELVPVLQDGAGAAGSSPPPRERLVIRRTLQGSSTKTHIKQPGSQLWQAVSQAQLQAELAPFNLHTQAVDRYIVTQSRQAVDVGDAVGLVRHLELLTGTSDYEPQIQLQGQLLEKLAQQLDQTQQEIGRLECERASLAPHVATWQRVQLLGKQAMAQERQLLLDQLEHGPQQTTLQQQLAARAEAAAASTAQDLAGLRAQEQQLAGQQDRLSAQLQQITKTQEALKRKVEKLSAAAAAAKVELSASAAAAKNQQTVAAKLDTRLCKLLAEEAGHKEQVAAAHLCLKQLQEEQATAERQLAAAKAAAATAGGASKQPVVSAIQLQLEQLAADKAAGERAKAAAAAAAAQAAAAVVQLETSQREVTAAAAASSNQLQLAQQQLQESRATHAITAAAVQQAEQTWKRAHVQLRIMQDQLQQGRTELQQCEQQLQHLRQQGRGSAAPGSFDAAIQHLHQLSTAGQLPGSFYGRLCNVVALTDATASDAVNAALQEVCNLSSTLVVSDRQTASAVISHFRQQKAGMVHCKILAEASNGAAAAGSSNRDVTPLLGFVAADDRSVPGIQALLQQLLGSWLLVPGGREAAVKLLHLRRNLVTRAGEVFKQDGEIVMTLQGSCPSGKSHHNSNSHGLTAQPSPVLGGSAGVAGDAACAAAESDAQALLQQLQQLQEQAATAQQVAGAADAALEQVRQALCRCHAEVTDAETAEQRVRSQEEADRSRLQRTLPDLQQRLAAAQEAASKAESGLAAAAADADAAAQRHQLLLQEQLASGRRKSNRGTGAGAAGNADDDQQAALCAAAQQLQQASDNVEAAWMAADSATQQQKRVARQLAAVQKELARVQGSATSQQQLNKQQAALSRLEQQRAACEAELAAAAGRRAELTNGLKPVKQQLQAAAKGRAAAAEACAAAKSQHEQHHKRLQELQQQQEQWQAALQQLLQRMEPADTGHEAVDVEMADAEAGCAARAGQITDDREPCTVSDAAAEAGEAAGSKPPSQARQRRSSRAAVGRSQRRTVRRRAVLAASSDDDDDVGNADGDGSDDVEQQQGSGAQAAASAARLLAKQGLLLQQRADQLSDRQQELADLAAQVDEAALDRELQALKDLAAATQLLQQLEQQHEAASALREQLLDERYGRLLAVLQALNGQLEQVYRQLTGGCGSAYCAYTQERRLLFSQGVTLHVQPDGNAWRQFRMLSGGQQALATLALSFALQALFPSPFYFFDEVDCALDTSAAARVAAYVREQCQPEQLPPPPLQNSALLPPAEQQATPAGPGKGQQLLRQRPGAQFLLVSHRPVVFETASCLLGVYSDGSGSSAAVVADFARN